MLANVATALGYEEGRHGAEEGEDALSVVQCLRKLKWSKGVKAHAEGMQHGQEVVEQASHNKAS